MWLAVPGLQASRCIDEYLGGGYSEMWQIVHRPHFDHCLRSDPFLENLWPPWKDGDNVLYKLSCGPIDSRKQYADTLTEPFRTQLRQATRLLTRPTPFFSPGKSHVAIHLHRGDIMVSPDLLFPTHWRWLLRVTVGRDSAGLAECRMPHLQHHGRRSRSGRL